MARKTPGPLETIAVRLPLGPDWGPRFEAVAERNSRTLTSELIQATRSWVLEQERAQVLTGRQIKGFGHLAAGASLPVVLP